MAFRFRRSIKIAPGVRVNIGKRGGSFSVGPRGSTMTFGRGGTFANIGVPGTGMSWRTKLGGGSGRRRGSGPTAKERKAMTVAQLEQEASAYNEAAIEGINQHRKIPPVPDKHTWKQAAQFILKPGRRLRIILFVLSWAFFLAGISVSADYAREGKPVGISVAMTAVFGFFALRPVYYLARRAMLRRKIKSVYGLAATGDAAAIEALLGDILESLDWFRETTPSFEVAPDGRAIYVDIDLPEIEDMPDCVKIVKKTAQIIEDKPKTEETLCGEYATHVHGIVMRVAGTCFAVFPTVENVLCSGYTQRTNKSSGNIQDEYVISALFTREVWKRSNPTGADPVSFVRMFTHRQSLAPGGRLEAIGPLTPSEA